MLQEAEGQKQHIPSQGPASLVHCQALGVAAVPPNTPVPVGTSWALCSQLLDSSPSCCSQEVTASLIRLENAFWFNKQRFF